MSHENDSFRIKLVTFIISVNIIKINDRGLGAVMAPELKPGFLTLENTNYSSTVNASKVPQ